MTISAYFISNPVVFTTLALLLSLITTRVLLNLIFRNKNKQQQQKKKYHPIVGTSFNQLINFNRLHHYMTRLAAKHGTYRLLNLSRYEVYTSDPANVEYILKTNFDNFGKVPSPKPTFWAISLRGWIVICGTDLEILGNWDICWKTRNKVKFTTILF